MADKDNRKSQWFRNAAKSIGYSLTDKLKEDDMAPTIFEILDTNQELPALIRQSVSDLKAKRRGSMADAGKETSKLYKDIKTIKDNALSDLKTGKLYNKERVDKLSEDSFGDFGDLDFDDDFGVDVSFDDNLSDSDFEDSDTKVVSPDITINANINDDNPMVHAVKDQTVAITDAAELIGKQNAQIADINLKHSSILTGKVTDGIDVMNSNLASLVSFSNEKISGYIESSLKYYEDSIGYLGSLVEEVKKISSPEAKQEEYKSNAIDDIFSYYSSFNVAEYGKYVKKRVVDAIDMNPFLSSIKMFMENDDMMDQLKSNPIGFVGSFLTGQLIPKAFQKSLNELDKSVKNFIPAMFKVISDWGSMDADTSGIAGKIKSVIGSIFGISESSKTGVNLNKYERGKVDFDGITRKSIIEVIPGYLSKILSALTGKEQLIYDYNTGTFSTFSNVDKRYTSDYNYYASSNYSANDKIKDKLAETKNENGEKLSEEDVKRLGDTVDKLFVNITKQNKAFNYRKIENEDGTEDQIRDLLPESTESDREIIRKIISGMSNSEKLGIVTDQEKNKRALKEFLVDVETNPKYESYKSLISGYFDYDAKALSKQLKENRKVDKDKASIVSTSTTSSFLNPVDSTGNRTIDHVREIKNMLLNGIGVFIKEGGEPGTVSTDNNNPNPNPNSPDDDTEKIISKSDMNAEERDEIEKLKKKEEDEKKKKKDKEKEKNKGIFSIFKGFGKDIKDGFFKTIDNGMKFLTGFMHDAVFGKEKGEGENGEERKPLFERLADKLTGMRDWIQTNFFDKISDKLFGDNGFFTKIKESDFFKSITDKTTKIRSAIGSYFLGEKGEDGKRTGGFFSSLTNGLKDMWSDVRYEITGKRYGADGELIETSENSMLGSIKSAFKSAGDGIRSLFFGNGGNTQLTIEGTGPSGIISQIGSGIKEGAQNFIDVIFGKSKNENGDLESNRTTSEVWESIKEKAPKAAAGGLVGGAATALLGAKGFGILGSMFLGPFSGIALGAGTALLAKSDKFKNWLFGEKDPETGERKDNGFISKSTQQFFGKNKSSILAGTAAGAGIGMFTGFGVLGSLFGGPLTGAALGLAGSLLAKSDAFQDFLFGKSEDGESKSLSEKFKESGIAKKLGIGAAGAIGGVGLSSALGTFGALGSSALLGPIPLAIAGVAAGIGLSGDKWREKIFGKYDEDGNKEGDGLLDKMAMGVTVHVLQPLKYTAQKWSYSVQSWFEESIALPFQKSLVPLKEELHRFKDRISDFFDTFVEGTGVKWLMGKLGGVVKTVGKGITGALKHTVEISGKLLGKVVSAPFKALGVVAEKILLPKHMREGIKNLSSMMWENVDRKLFTPIREGVQSIGTIISEGIQNIRNDIKSWIKDTALPWVKDKAKKAGKAIGTGAKKIGSKVKNSSFGKWFGDTFGGDGAPDEELIKRLYTGDLSVGQSIWTNVKAHTPFSRTRKAAKNTAVKREWLEERIKRQETEDKEKFLNKGYKKYLKQNNLADSDELREKYYADNWSDEDEEAMNERIESRTNKAEKRMHGGAGYASKWKNDIKNQKEIYAQRRKDRQEALDKIKGKLDENKSILSAVDSYDELTDEQKQALSMKDFNKVMDNALGKKYGKDYKNLDTVEKEKIKNEEIQKDATVAVRDSLNNPESVVNKKLSFIESIYALLKDKFGGNKQMTSDNTNNKNDENKVKAASDDVDNEQITWDSVINGGSKQTSKGTSVTLDDGSMANTDDGKAGTTEDESRAKRELKDDEEEKTGFLGRMQGIWDSIKGIGKEQKEQGFNWRSIFSKTGLITGGILLALPFILKFFKDPAGTLSSLVGGLGNILETFVPKITSAALEGFKELSGLEDKDGDRTDASGDTQVDYGVIKSAEQVVVNKGIKLVRKPGAKVVKDVAKVWRPSNVVKTWKGTAPAAVREGTEAVAREGVETAVETAAREGTEAVAREGVETAVESTAKSGSKGIISKFISMAKSALKNVMAKIISAFPGIADNVVANAMKKGFNVLKESILGKFVKRITTFIARMTTQSAAAAGTGFVSEAVMILAGGAYGALSDASVAHLFQVKQEDVDGKMRTISGIIGAIFATTVGAVVDIIDSIVEAVSGFSFVRGICIAIYKWMISGDEKALAEFDRKINKFDVSYDAYTETQQIMKGGVQLDENGNIVRDETGKVVLKEDAKVEGKNSYNDRVNKGFFGSIIDGVASGAKSVWNLAGNGKKGDFETYANSLKAREELEYQYNHGKIGKEDYEFLKENIEDTMDDSEKTQGSWAMTKDFWFGHKANKKDMKKAEKYQAELDAMVSDGSIKKDSKEYKELKKIVDGYKKSGKKKKNIFGRIGDWFTGGDEESEDIATELTTTKSPDELIADSESILNDDNKTGLPDTYGKNDMDKMGLYYTSAMTAPIDMVGNISNSLIDVYRERWTNTHNDWVNFQNEIDNEYKGKKKSKKKKKKGKGGGFISDLDTLRTSSDGKLHVGGSTEFDLMNNYGSRTQGWTSSFDPNHRAFDFDAGNNTDVPAFTDGTVVDVINNVSPDSGYIGNTDGGGFGNRVVIQDSAGKYHVYGHLNSVNVGKGDVVNAGTVIGKQGHTGSSTASHLHYQISDGLFTGTRYNPEDYLKSYNGRNHPNATSGKTSADADIPSNDVDSGMLSGISGITSSLESLVSTIEKALGFDKLESAFSSIFGFDSDKKSDEKSGTPGTTPSSVGVSGAKNLSEEIALKTFELTAAGEGDYSSVNPSDNGPYSVGKIQFHEGKAKEMFTRLAGKLTGKDKETASRYASMSNRALTSSEAAEMEAFLKSPSVKAASEEVQNTYALELISESNLKTPFRMFNEGTLLDPRSLILAGDIGNTGPAHLDTWGYTKKAGTTLANELGYVRDSLKSGDSYWGRATGSPYYRGWMNRIDNTYSSLSNWKPKYFDYGTGKPIGGGDDAMAMRELDRFGTNTHINKSGSTVMRAVGSGSLNIPDKIYTIMNKMVNLLTSIATNTEGTTTEIKQINEKTTKTSTSGSNSSNSSNMNATGQGTMYDIANSRRESKRNSSYEHARLIASGI